jgi:hypothetical protein
VLEVGERRVRVGRVDKVGEEDEGVAERTPACHAEAPGGSADDGAAADEEEGSTTRGRWGSSPAS